MKTKFTASFTVCLTLFLFLSTSITLFAQPGRLDVTFGTGGILTTDIQGFTDQANAVLMLPDGRILVGGTTVNNASGIDDDMALAMYLPDGSLDSSFSGNGLHTSSIGGRDAIKALAVQPDGKILAATNFFLNNNNDIALVRYLPNAAKDITFGTFAGTNRIDLGTNQDVVNDMVLLPDGKIILVGSKGGGVNSDFVVIRFTELGIVDSSFGTDGIVTTDFTGNVDYAYAVALQSDGKLVVAGRVNDGQATDNEAFGVARYLPNGDLDASFGTGGKLFVKFTGFIEWANDVAILPSGRIVVAGHCHQNGILKYAITRLETDGSLDNTFGTGGKSILSFGSWSHANSLAVQPDGKYLIGGFGGAGQFFIARTTVDGQLDPTFTDSAGIVGGVLTTIGNFAECTAMALQADGRLVAVGTSGNDFAVVRYLTDGNVGIHPTVFEANSLLISPNPVQDKATLAFSLTQPQTLHIQLLDYLGREIKTLVNQPFASGQYEIDFAFSALPAGMYLLRLTGESEIATLRILK